MKIPLRIDPSFWVLSVLLSWVSSSTISQFLAWMSVVFISIFVHEMGHALVAKMWGQRVQIILGSLGGATAYQGRALPPAKEFLVVLAGPLFGLSLAAVSFFLVKQVPIGGFAAYFFGIMTWANVVWSLFNLLPVHPFDGGKVMGIILEGLFGPAGMRFSYLLSGLFAILLSAITLYMYQIFACALLLMCAFESFVRYRQKRYFHTSATEKRADELEKAEQDMLRMQPERAVERLEKIIQSSDGDKRPQAVEKLAVYYTSSGQIQKAYNLLSSQKKLEGEVLKLFQLLCYKLGYWEESLEAGSKFFRDVQETSCAVMNAFSAARLQDVTLCLNWLSTVKRSRVDLQPIIAAEDFDAIRSDTRFQQFTSSK